MVICTLFSLLALLLVTHAEEETPPVYGVDVVSESFLFALRRLGLSADAFSHHSLSLSHTSSPPVLAHASSLCLYQLSLASS